MKKTILLCLLSCSAFAQKELNIMTYNLRYATPKDGDNQWDNRKEKLASVIQFYEADICGMQEALIGQIRDLEKLLPPTYAWVGKGRDDGQEAGEFSCIFYRKDKFKLLNTQTFWLNEHPETVGFGWDAKLNRVATYAKFERNSDKKVFYFFNTHFDHIAVVARRESAKLVLAKIKEIAGKTPTILTGDFNATPTDEPIKIIVDSSNPDRLIDSESVSAMPHFGPFSSFNGFESKDQEGRHIDYIFLKNGNFKVKKHATISQTWNGRFASDHHAVLAVLSF